MRREKIVLGVLAHVDAGKTTLSESILYNTGVIRSQGRVDHKDTFLDTDTIEKERGITIYSKDARFSTENKDVVLIDTPGHVDFSSEMERVLPVLDVAILIINATSGIQAHTKTLWNLLDKYKIPVVFFVNKMDMPGADKDSILRNIQRSFSDSAIDFSDISSESFCENIATCDAALLDEYLQSGVIDNKNISDLISNRKLYPVLFGSAIRNEGVIELINVIDRFIPNPAYDFSTDPYGLVYKITRDSNGRRLTHIKLLSGQFKVKDFMLEEKANELLIISGNKYTNTSTIEAGDICAICGPKQTFAGQYFGIEKTPVLPMLSPALCYSVIFSNDTDINRMFTILKELEEEDSSLNVQYQKQSQELLVSLMGDVQTEILCRKIKDRYDVDVSFGEGKVCYKETITDVIEGVGHFEPLRHYAEAHIKIEPLPLGSGIIYEADIREDLLDRNWQNLILTHLKEKQHLGVLTGSPLTDVKYSLVSGKSHLKHTEGGDFRQATYRAIRQGLMELKHRQKCALLEPVYDFTLIVPNELVGRALTDINRMCGAASISSSDAASDLTTLTGTAPVSTMNSYPKEVAIYTKGLGQISLIPAGYAPCHNEEEVLSASTYNPDADLDNPSSSVFCSHGAGIVIPWNEVCEHMHLPIST